MNKEELKELEEIRKLAERNYKLISKNTENIDKNFEKIKDNSYALSILKDYKHEAIMWKIAFFITLALLIIVAIHHFIIK